MFYLINHIFTDPLPTVGAKLAAFDFNIDGKAITLKNWGISGCTEHESLY